MPLFEVKGWNLPSSISQKAAEKKKTLKKKSEKRQDKPDDEARVHKPKAGTKRVKNTAKEQLIRNAIETTRPKTDSHDEQKVQEVEDETVLEKRSEEKLEKKPEAENKHANKLTPLQQKMKEKLSGSRFRWINEQLYTIDSAEAVTLIKDHPEMFDEYHEGFRSQVSSWPENPVGSMVGQIRHRLSKPIGAPGGLPGNGKDGTVVIADMGCGEAQLAQELATIKGHGKTKRASFKVHSFDLKKANEYITVSDIKSVPLPNESVNVVVFCLALMGTNFLDFIHEGLRILKPNGEMWIAEIKSRFAANDTKEFVDVLCSLGLLHKTTDDSNKMFVRFEFFRPTKDVFEGKRRSGKIKDKDLDIGARGPEGQWLLKPCIYKRR